MYECNNYQLAALSAMYENLTYPGLFCISLLQMWFNISCTIMVLNVSVQPPCVLVRMHGSCGWLK